MKDCFHESSEMKGKEIRTGISYFGCRNPSHFLEDLEDIIEHNCNFIVHTFSENDQSYYKGTLEEFGGLSKEKGLEVWIDPWGVGRVFGGEASSEFVLKNREVSQIFSSGDPAPAACVNNPLFREFMATWVSDAKEIGGDVVFWDEPHFFIDWERRETSSERWTCWCRFCMEKYRKIYGESLPSGYNRETARFREDSIVDFLGFLLGYAHSKGLRNALCLLPWKDSRYGLSDWSRIASLSSIDILGTDPYWLWFGEDVESFVGNLAEEICSLSREYGKEAQIWIQAFKIPAGKEPEIEKAVRVARGKGVCNFAAWSYSGTAYMSHIKSDNPERVWEIIGQTYGKLLKGDL